jgi:hypothetical protein
MKSYDPTHSPSFVALFGNEDDPKILNQKALQALEDSYGLMTEELTDAVQESLSRLDEPTDFEWLLEYMRLHFEEYKTHFVW